MESAAAVNEALMGATALRRDGVGEAFVRDCLAFLIAEGAAHGVLG